MSASRFANYLGQGLDRAAQTRSEIRFIRGVTCGAQFLRYAVAVAAAFAAQAAAAQEWKPQKNVDIVVTSDAGGAADRQARVAQKFLQSMPGFASVSVTNRPGGAGTVGWTFMTQHPGDGHYIATLNTALVTNQIMGLSQVRYQDLTPLNILMHEYVVGWVRTASPIASGKDLIARLKRDPASVSFGISPEWKKVQEEFVWGWDFKNSAQTRRRLDAEYELLRKMLADLGVIPR